MTIFSKFFRPSLMISTLVALSLGLSGCSTDMPSASTTQQPAEQLILQPADIGSLSGWYIFQDDESLNSGTLGDGMQSRYLHVLAPTGKNLTVLLAATVYDSPAVAIGEMNSWKSNQDTKDGWRTLATGGISEQIPIDDVAGYDLPPHLREVTFMAREANVLWIFAVRAGYDDGGYDVDMFELIGDSYGKFIRTPAQ